MYSNIPMPIEYLQMLFGKAWKLEKEYWVAGLRTPKDKLIVAMLFLIALGNASLSWTSIASVFEDLLIIGGVILVFGVVRLLVRSVFVLPYTTYCQLIKEINSIAKDASLKNPASVGS